MGVAPAAAFGTTRRHLDDRKAAGLDGGMRFTYLRPERSTDPGTTLPDARALIVAARSYRRAVAPEPGGGTPSGGEDRPRGAAPVGRVARYA